MQKYRNRTYSVRQPYDQDHQMNQNECNQQHYYLNEKGVHQALRNRSDSIWLAMGCTGVGFAPCFSSTSTKLSNPTLNMSQINTKNGIQDYRIQRPQKQSSKLQQDKQQNSFNRQKTNKSKNVSFNIQNAKTLSNTVNIGKIVNGNSQNINKKQLSKQQQQAQRIKRQKFLQECYSIDKYLKNSKAYTRQMPNSAIKLLYQKPCLQAYGRKNTSGNNGFVYNDFMKTHNVLPHRMGNQPKKYQAYRSSLNFCKRTKIDLEERWIKIHRKMKNRVNMDELVQHFAKGTIDVDQHNLQQVLKLNINSLKGNQFKRSKSLQNIKHLPPSQYLNDTTTLNLTKTDKLDLNTTKATDDLRDKSSDRISQLKRSKSWGKKQYLFLYKYTNKEGESHYCKDRHGINCYVDPNFRQNQQAYTKFLKRIKPIEAEDVSPSDRNIDQQLVNNFIKSQQQEIPKHYLLPNCDEPQKYRPEKYSWKSKRKSTIETNNIDLSAKQ